jgi:hypothetical protein
MWAVGKKGGSRFVRFGLHDGVAADVVFDIRGPVYSARSAKRARLGPTARTQDVFTELANKFSIGSFFLASLTTQISSCLSG